MTVRIFAEGLSNLESFLARAPDITREAARIAVNDVARGEGRTAIKKAMTTEIAFPPGYLNEDRLTLIQRATNANLEAVIEGRKRATSLARFATGGAVGVRNRGVSVRVKPGSTRRLAGAFLVRLRAGKAISEDSYNIGLAVRLKPGQAIRNKKQMAAVQLDHNVYILYGPSVDQVFRTVAVDVSPKIAEQVETEFYRQFGRLAEGG